MIEDVLDHYANLRTVCSHVCISLCTTVVVHYTAQNSSVFPPSLETIITAQMLPIEGEGVILI